MICFLPSGCLSLDEVIIIQREVQVPAQYQAPQWREPYTRHYEEYGIHSVRKAFIHLNRLLKGEKFSRCISVEGLLGHNKMCKNRMPRNYKEFSRSREIQFLGIPKAEPEGDGLDSGGYGSRAVRLH